MDANGLRSFGIGFDAGLYAWRTPLEPEQPDQRDAAKAIGVEASHGHRITAVRLASRSPALPLEEARGRVADVALEPAMAIDAAGNTVRWDVPAQQLLSASAVAALHPELAPVALAFPTGARAVADLTLGADGVLYVAANGALWLLDPRARFEATRFEVDEFAPQKLAALPGGGVLALDVGRGRLARISGLPLTTAGVEILRERDHRFEACERNPAPLRATVLPARFEAGERSVGIACNAEGDTVVLTLALALGGARIRLLRADATLAPPVPLSGPLFPHTIGWLDAEHFAVATQGALREPGRPARDPGVFVYPLPAPLRERLRSAPKPGVDLLRATGDYYPLAGWTGGPFVNAPPGTRLHYPRANAPTGAAPVARISAAARARYGVVANSPQQQVGDAAIQSAIGLIDCGNATATWHRLYVEGCVPPGSAMLVWLAVSDLVPRAFEPGAATQPAWHPHVIGDRRALPAGVLATLEQAPRAVWVREASEVAFGQSLLVAEREPGKSGLFTVLIQRSACAVRALRGRRLWVVVEFFGDGRATPELVALRAYASRVSYRDRYLPALYHETLFGTEADRPARATGPDFLERFIHLFEGTFTAIEDKIAAAWLLTDAHACPASALPWLASWIGMALEPGTPEATARRMIANAGRLAARHGTLEGLRLALDIATTGGITAGRIVVVENWRLRRTLATILGADLTDADDALTAGITQSGNSVVGDSLFLGDENAKTFLALFRDLRPDPATGSLEAKPQADEREAAFHALYDGLAWRVTVLVHEAASADELGLVRRVAEASTPAHVLLGVHAARYPFMVGVASLVGADTYLVAGERPQPVRVDASCLGYRDTLQGEGWLDANGGAFDEVLASPSADAGPPVARIRASHETVQRSEPFELDGSESTAAPGRSITLYRWGHQPPE